MIHEFAVEPEVMATWEHFRLLWKDFGVGEGRFLAEYPNDWRKRVYELADKCCGPVHANSIKSRLQDQDSRRAKLVGVCGRDFNGGEWLSNAIRHQGNERRFRAIVARSNPLVRPDVLPAAEFDPDSEPWYVGREKPVRRVADELVGAARPLLQHCRELVCVDPHFDPRETRYQRPFEGFAQIQTRWRRLEIHRALPEPFRKDVQKSNYRYLLETLPDMTSLTVVFWPRLMDRDTIHARYVLTERGAIGYDWGLDEGQNPAQTTVVRLVEHENYLRLREQYRRDSHWFGEPQVIQIEGGRE